MSIKDLKAGALLYTRGMDGKAVPLRLATLFRQKDNPNATYGLVTNPHTGHTAVSEPFAQTELYSGPDLTPASSVGHFANTAAVLPGDEALDSLFAVFELDHKLGGQVKKLTYSKDFADDAFSAKPMEIMEIQAMPASDGVTDIATAKGHLIGDVINAELHVGDKSLTLGRAGLAKGFGDAPFAEIGANGSPIISDKKHSLVGFVIGKADDQVLFMPAEDLATKHNIEFFGPSGSSKRKIDPGV